MSNKIGYFCEKKMCTGCRACFSSCPVHCIKMEKDELGFEYPIATDQCIDCHICENVCPILKNTKNINRQIFPKKIYAATSKDNKIWRNSASGGAFTEICKSWDNGNTIICGASWEGLSVRHKCVEGVKNIKPLQKSKYVASSLDDNFQNIKMHLENKKRVVFCGTPCQVAGLKEYLGHEYDNLLLIDLICHGVGSPNVFMHCINLLESTLGIEIKAYSFREKGRVFHHDHINKIMTSNNKEILLVGDPYIQLFVKQLCLRESCISRCKFKCTSRQGDITIGDFKHLYDVFPNLKGSKKNYSTIIINSEKGNNVFSLMKSNLEYYECEEEYILKYNPMYSNNSKIPEDRELFLKEYINDAETTLIKWTKPAKIYNRNISRKIYDFLPVFIRKMVNRG